MYRNFICYRGSSSAGLQVANELYHSLLTKRNEIGETYFSPINDTGTSRNFLLDPIKYISSVENFIIILTKDFFTGFLNSDGTANKTSVTLVEITEALKNPQTKFIPIVFPDFTWDNITGHMSNREIVTAIWGEEAAKLIIGAMPIPYVFHYKNEVFNLVISEISPIVKSKKVIIFDFDGTLTVPNYGYNTWESLWIALGYPVEYCEKYHKMYSNHEITHDEWCEITEKYFKEAKLGKHHLYETAKDAKLLPDTQEVIYYLKSKGFALYILSGSIKQFIEIVLGKDLALCFSEIKANRFVFDSQGLLEGIIGTPYDFEGKARFVTKIIDEKHIAPNEILYIGNSFNDEFVYKSGVETLCINPAQTDFYNNKIWHNYLRNVKSLKDVLPFIEK